MLNTKLISLFIFIPVPYLIADYFKVELHY